MAVYLDWSALVKLAVREPESTALRRYLSGRRPLVSSALARTEVLRALLPSGNDALARGRELLRRLDLVRVNDQLLLPAGVLWPAELRTLDGLHLATARHLGSDLNALVTYDARMATAGKALGLRIVQPR